MSRQRLELTILTLTSIVGAVGLKSAFVDWGFAPLVVLSALGAVSISWFAHRLKIPAPLAVLASVFGYLLIGTVLTYGFPWELPSFALDNIRSWRRILTIAAPVDAQSTLVVVPVAAAWFGSVLGAELALRTKRTLLPLAGPLLSVSLAILFGLDSDGIATSIGITVLVLATLFLAVRAADNWLYATDRKSAGRKSRLLLAACSIALVAIVAPLITPSIPLVNARDRFTFRDEVDPPFDLRRLPSPLAEIKAYLPTAAETEANDLGRLLFTVSGDEVDRFRLSVLDDYNGVVWLISRNADGADFIRAGTQFPAPDAINRGAEVDHTVEIVDLRESWLPSAGTAVRLDITSDVDIDGVSPVELVRLDRVTGNLIMRPRLTTVTGLTYDIGSVPARSADDVGDQILDAAVLTSARDTRLPELPPSIARRAQTIVDGDETPYERVKAIESSLSGEVYDAESKPGHTIAQLATFVERDPMVGYDEQYAAAMATMLRSLGIPSRVVVGFVPSDEAKSTMSSGGKWNVYESDIETWVEVPFEDIGWVAFQAGPDDNQTEEVEEGFTEAQAESLSANPPPPTTSTTSTTIPDAIEDEEEETDDEEDDSAGVPTAVIALAIALGVPALLFGFFVLAVMFLKRRRRLRRRKETAPAEQVFGAFRELVDRSHDSGVEIPAGSTPRQAIRSIVDDELDLTSRSGSLAVLVEEAGYSPNEPDPEMVSLAWEHSDALIGRLSADQTSKERLRAKLSMASLRLPHRGDES